MILKRETKFESERRPERTTPAETLTSTPKSRRKQSTATNGLVLDGFLGSASTLIACEQIDRVCFGVELEETFVDVAVKRFRQYCQENDKEEEIYVIRDGQKLMLDEVAGLEEEE